MTHLLSGLRKALRALARRPGYTALVAGTLALGIGAAAAVFALVDGVLLRPLPYPESERLVLVRQQSPRGDWNTSAVDFQAIAEQQRSFAAVAAMQRMDLLLTGAGEPRWVNTRRVTAEFFDVMGIMPAHGRAFRAGEDRPGVAPTVVIGHAFAAQVFGGKEPLGRALTLDGVTYTVIGVMPPGAEALAGMSADAWPVLQLETPQRRGPFFLSTVARLKPGMNIAQATEDLDAISRRIFPLWRSGFQDETARLVPRSLHDAVVGEARDFLWVAFAAVGMLLLIAIVNAANLVAIRVSERAGELAVRAALGASRRRVALLLVGESLTLAVFGALAGLGLAALLLQLYAALGPGLPRLAEIALDARTVAFAGLAALAAGFVLGILPLLIAGSLRDAAGLHGSRDGGAGRAQQAMRSGLVAAQFALALPLLIAAGLLADSLLRLQHVDPGFDPQGVLVAQLRLQGAHYPDPQSQQAFRERALAELRALPGVTAAGFAGAAPPDCGGCYNNFDLVDRPAGQGNQPQSPWVVATPEYFAMLGVPSLEGRLFDTRDTPDSPPVILVSQAWAQRHFPGESVVGKRLYEGGDVETPVTIAGVVADVKFDGLGGTSEAVYAPASQGWRMNPAWLFLRTGGSPLALAAPMRAALQRLDAELAPTDITTLQGRLHDSLGDHRHRLVVIAAFAVAALALSAIGVFGVMAYYVARQYREIGVRLALGADASRISRLVLGRGLASALAGSVAGFALAVYVAYGMASLLYETRPLQPLVLAGASALLFAVALAACWIPARRAANVQPMIALRHE